LTSSPTFVSLGSFSGLAHPYHAPYPDSIVMEPGSMLKALAAAPEPTKFQQGDYYDYVQFLTDRVSHKWQRIIYFRKESLRPYGRILLNVLTALMVGRVDFRVRPDSGQYDLVKEVYTKLFQRYLYPLIRIAVSDYFICGLGGVSMTPMGLAPLRPENVFAFPSFHDPLFTIRMFICDWNVAKEIFNHPSLKDEPPPIGVEHDKTKGRHGNSILFSQTPAVVLLEKVSRTKIEYYYGNNKLLEMRRPHGYGHFLLVGDPRDIDYGYSPHVMLERAVTLEELAGDPTGGMYWVSERAHAFCELPVGLIEQLVSHFAYGYNLLEAHQRLIEAIYMRTTRSNVCAIRADLINAEDPNAQDFVDYYKPIFLMGGEAGTGAPIQFLDVVSLPEIQAGLREIENQITAITGITPYMMGLSGISDVASEIVVMQSQANARINHIHSYLVRWLGEVVDQFGLYLAKLKPEYQEPLTAYDVSSGQKVVVGGVPDQISATPVIDYSQLFGRYYIEPTLVGEITNINRRNELMQALQLTMQILPILAQMGGEIYDVKAITDHILKTFNIDPGQITLSLAHQGAPGAAGGGATATPAMPPQPVPSAVPEPTNDPDAAMPVGQTV